MPAKVKKNARGFGEYLKMKDSYGAEVKVTESSGASKHCVWIFVKGGGIVASGGINDGAAHLDKEQAQKVIEALQAFLETP